MTEVVRSGAWPAVLGVALLLLTGCAAAEEEGSPRAGSEPAPSAAPEATGSPGRAEGVLAAPGRAGTAFTYDPALAPEGARVAVDVSRSWPTQVRLEVTGLLPYRGYAAHAHANACGPTGEAAGPHFQNRVDPAAGPGRPSTDPAYANPENEIWLDLRTDGAGAGESTATVPFTFTDRAPASVVIHEAAETGTAPGKAGSAGARLACLDVPFR